MENIIITELQNFFKLTIRLYGDSIKTYRRYTILDLLAGASLILFAVASPWKPDDNVVKGLMTIGGSLVGAVALYPVDRVLDCKKKIAIFENTIEKLQRIEKGGKKYRAELKDIQEFKRTVENRIGTL